MKIFAANRIINLLLAASLVLPLIISVIIAEPAYADAPKLPPLRYPSENRTAPAMPLLHGLASVPEISGALATPSAQGSLHRHESGPGPRSFGAGSLWEVYVNATTGNDSYDGSSPIVMGGGVGPRKTIQAGIDVCDYDGRVNIAPGRYRENLEITFSIYIEGTGARNTIIDGGGAGPVININASYEYVDIYGVTICNGDGGYAGGVVNGSNCDVYIQECAITGNSGDVAGGIFNQNSELFLDMCLIADNVARVCGGGVLNYDASMVAYDCTFSGNSLAAGGNEGGGLCNFGAFIVMLNTTVANNSARGLPVSRGGGMASYLTGIAIVGTIFAGNSASVAGTGNAYCDSCLTIFEAFNIDSENSCGFSTFTSQVNTDPLIGPLQDNGGPTNTHAISPDSPALDRGFPGDYIDQRGVARPQGLANDIGAFELEMHNTNVRVNAQGGTGPEAISFSSSAGGIFYLRAWPPYSCAKSLPEGMIYPYGLFSFRVVSIVPGSQVRITIKFPRVIPATFQYFKCGPNGLVNITSLVAHNPGDDFIVLTLTDGGPGDMDGVANGKITDPGGPAWVVNPVPQSSSAYIAPPQRPVSLPDLSVQKAALSAAEVKPGEPVMVTASIANRGGAKGAIKLSLYVNGEEEAVQGLTVESGSSVPVSFILSRNEPGVYSVYLGNTSAGEFRVSGGVDPNIILVLSMAMVLTSLVMGLALLYRRQRP